MPSGPRIGDAITARVPSPSAAACVDDLREHLAVNGRIAHDAMVRPALAHFELGLHEGDDRAAGGGRPERGRDRPEDEGERDERDVDDGEVDRLAEDVAMSASGRSSDRGRRLADRGRSVGELATPDVDRMDPRGAALQQDVGEAAGRRARVEADRPRRIDPERVERRGELVTAAADVRIRLHDLMASVPSTRSPAFRSIRAASPSPTRTLPARISAWALARVSARPRSTRSWSRRWRADRSAVARLTRLSWHSRLHHGSPTEGIGR